MSRVYDYLDKLEKDKQLFVDILNSKDITSSSEETFSTLVPKVNDMANINSYYDMTKRTSGGINQYIKQIPMIDTSGYTNMASMFQEYKSLITIPLLDTSNVTNMYGMFSDCTSLTTIPQLDTSNVTKTDWMFRSCIKLTTIPQLDTSKVTNMGSMFYDCDSLKEIPELNTSNVTTMFYMFRGCKSLTIIPLLDTSKVTSIEYMFHNCQSLTTLGGFTNLGKAYDTTKSANYSSYKLNLSYSSKLTHDSLMNVVNNLYDIAAKGCQPQQLQLGSTNLAKLTDEEIAIATNKGWTVS